MWHNNNPSSNSNRSPSRTSISFITNEQDTTTSSPPHEPNSGILEETDFASITLNDFIKILFNLGILNNNNNNNNNTDLSENFDSNDRLEHISECVNGVLEKINQMETDIHSTRIELDNSKNDIEIINSELLESKNFIRQSLEELKQTKYESNQLRVEVESFKKESSEKLSLIRTKLDLLLQVFTGSCTGSTNDNISQRQELGLQEEDRVEEIGHEKESQQQQQQQIDEELLNVPVVEGEGEGEGSSSSIYHPPHDEEEDNKEQQHRQAQQQAALAQELSETGVSASTRVEPIAQLSQQAQYTQYNQFTQQQPQQQLAQAVQAVQAVQASMGEIEQDTEEPYRYALLKQITSIRQIWDEYAYGLNGEPSIKSLQMKFKTKWRYPEDASTFKRRKRIYKAIEIAMMNGMTEEKAISELENHRLAKEGNYRRSLQWLCDNIPDKFKGV
ncbi:hypothetical protein PACTADRAFT_2748 [Pachysolen tannophilus NRRL Y-2460]|uniref:Transcription activator GCR1-like domain-containing protein n=1 Tax=Pachysolen tannophilus NRRL Y-2460 TaxID=669874 RepID=A0A1E4TXG8_PACTA|nr:hypothetical protein PACTADRAFT_2748 [Pachysolen tannophilus NRRL Y-2460]